MNLTAYEAEINSTQISENVEAFFVLGDLLGQDLDRYIPTELCVSRSRPRR